MRQVAGRIRDEDVAEVRRRANLVEVAGEYMHLKRAGRQFRALCPFHAEKTPSLYVDPTKNLYLCHGCREGGDVFTLVMKLESLSFVETVERLARRTGVDLRYEQLSPSERGAHRRRMRLVEAHAEAVDHYHGALMSSPEAADARRYLSKERGFTKETVEAFRVGWSPAKRDALCAHLRARGFTEEEVVQAGLGVRAEGGMGDRFRGRVMFPVYDVTGQPVAFGARRLGEGDGPKYLNSAESPIYKKGNLLYGLSLAKGEVVRSGRALVVEGYTDVIALHQAGIREAVATCGTALGLEHLRTLQRFTQQVILSLDADEAGGAAAERTYDQLIGDAQRMGLQVKVVLMPAGDDPADSVASAGADGFRALVERAVPLVEFVLRREAARHQVGDPEVRSRALAAAVRILARTEKQEVRDEYVRRLSGWIKVDPNIIAYELDRVLRTGVAPRAIGDSVVKRSSAQVRREREALKLAIQHPPIVKPYAQDVTEDTFSVPAHRAIWRALASGADPAVAGDALRDDDRAAYIALAVEPAVGEVSDRLAQDVFVRLKEFVLARRIDDLKDRLQRLNPVESTEEYDSRFSELMELEGARRRLSGEGT